MTDRPVLGSVLWSLGGTPQRVLDALERAATITSPLADTACPVELVSDGALSTLAADVHIPHALAVTSVAPPGPIDAPAPRATRRSVVSADAPVSRAPTVLPTRVQPATTPGSHAGASQASTHPEPPIATTAAPRGRELARAWLAAKANRAGAPAAIDQLVELTPVTAIAPPVADSTRAAPGERLARVLDRLAPATATARRAPTAPTGDRAASDSPLAPAPASARASRPVPAQARAAASVPPSLSTAYDPRDPLAPPVPALAKPPSTALRRFAMLAEAADAPPPAIAEPASLGPRDPEPPLPPTPLDEVEVADLLTRILRREARRDGIELEPPP